MLSTLFDPFFDTGFVSVPARRSRQRTGDQLQEGGRSNTALSKVPDSSIWDFNYFLSEPLTLGLQDNGDKFTMQIAAPPGIELKDLRVELNDNFLSVHGSRSMKSETAQGKESRFVEFQRSLLLPDNVDKNQIKANGKNGHLVIELPKMQGSSRRIEIGGSGAPQFLKQDEESKSAMDTSQTGAAAQMQGQQQQQQQQQHQQHQQQQGQQGQHGRK